MYQGFIGAPAEVEEPSQVSPPPQGTEEDEESNY